MSPVHPNFPVLQVDLTGRTALVVGSNVGLGFEAAKHLARMSPKRLIATSRLQEQRRSAKRRKKIKKDTGFGAVECWPLELTSFASIKAFADRFEREGGGRLDVVILNAAMAHFEYAVTEDGFERVLQTNHLGGALLSHLLLPTLLKTGHETGRVSRLAIVSSGLYETVKFSGDKFPKDKGIIARLSEEDSMDANRYSETKLLNILFGRALQSHLPADAPLIVTTIDPGFCISELRRSVDRGQWDDLLKTARTTEEGSRQLILGALGEKGGIDAWRGGYLSDNELKPFGEWVRSDEGKAVQERVWKETLDISIKADARVAEAAKLFTT
ncbi:hypothetical protein EIP91_004772 [Steccherinum ochraceum]|uniref:Uncharacterized protein n=1 Tax=Steccherinum ochraceum TaxID=92696 RepID=A0A4R0REC8_9APHY|nr:hypothetical protein EIP91_004772 [Steccherinum ochraceum]